MERNTFVAKNGEYRSQRRHNHETKKSVQIYVNIFWRLRGLHRFVRASAFLCAALKRHKIYDYFMRGKKQSTEHSGMHEFGCRQTAISEPPVLLIANYRSSDAAWIYPRLRIPLELLHSLFRKDVSIQQSPLVF